MPNGEDPSIAHIFMVTHTRKNGNPVDEESGRVINDGGSINNINVNDMFGALNLPMTNAQDSNSTNNILDIGSPHEHSFSRASNIHQNHERPSLVISRGTGPQASNEKIVEEVFLKSWIEVDLVIASGIIVSRDSRKKVGGVELGDFFCEVSIEIPIQPLAPLIRPYSDLRTIGDVTGKTIAWLKMHELAVEELAGIEVEYGYLERAQEFSWLQISFGLTYPQSWNLLQLLPLLQDASQFRALAAAQLEVAPQPDSQVLSEQTAQALDLQELEHGIHQVFVGLEQELLLLLPVAAAERKLALMAWKCPVGTQTEA
ncbi:hypothetical protein Taro_049423 [Colocasia esculenta]|uniref:Transposase Tnp1/En/Spm-like domain-containing protein n=1 Tax=Colocasia esculenta TaxID=4460 RepID=A0A843XB21_COLES|nr:hypothetical protein [Colocasia esculenta]